MITVSGIDLTAVGAANFLGVLLTVILLVSGRWRFNASGKENSCFIRLLFLVMLACAADPVVFAFDGKPGAFAKNIVFFGNSYLFLANIITSRLWLAILTEHLGIRLSRVHRGILAAAMALGCLLLAVNIRVPVIFRVDENNIYTRSGAYWYFLALNAAMLLDSLLLYIRAMKKGSLRFFPVALYIVPVVLGVGIQSVVYGISLIWPCAAVAVAGVTVSLQNELIFRDKLTGLYNRYYLDHLKNRLSRKRKNTYYCIMLDLNGFKQINDTFGHSVGDEALVNTGRLLTEAVGSAGTVIRLGGDEFVLILNIADDSGAEKKLDELRAAFDCFNAGGTAPYRLSASFGWCRLDLGHKTPDDILNSVDRRMYESKAAFYHDNPGLDRRRR